MSVLEMDAKCLDRCFHLTGNDCSREKGAHVVLVSAIRCFSYGITCSGTVGKKRPCLYFRMETSFKGP